MTTEGQTIREALDELTTSPWPLTDDIKARILPEVAALEARLAATEQDMAKVALHAQAIEARLAAESQA